MTDTIVRPEYGPSLPRLLSRGALRVVLGAAALIAVVALALIVKHRHDKPIQAFHREAPVFNVLHPRWLHPRRPFAGELMRFAQRRHGLSVAVIVRPLHLPPYRGTVSAMLPVYVTRMADHVRAHSAGFRLHDEGKARFNLAPGYQVAYRTGRPGAYTFERDVYLVPADGQREGVVVVSRQTQRGGAGDAALAGTFASVFRSFNFGTDRAPGR